MNKCSGSPIELKIQQMCVLLTLTMQSVDPKIQQQTAHTDTAGTTCDFAHQRSCRSRGSDGQNASHSAYTFYSAWPSLVAGSCKKRNKKAWMQTQCYSDFIVYINVMGVPVKSSIRSAAALRNFALEESSPPVLHRYPLMFPERVKISA